MSMTYSEQLFIFAEADLQVS